MKFARIKTGLPQRLRRGILLLLAAQASLVFCADKPDPEKFDKESLALRTALHYDPSQTASLDRLTKLYQESSRTEELIGMYQAQLAEFPEDTSSLIVLIQIFRALNDVRVEALLATAMARQEENSQITYLQYQQWNGQQDPRAAETLAKAITQEKSLPRKRQWSIELIRLTKKQDKEALIKPVLEGLIEEKGQGPADLISLGKELLGASHLELARAAIAKALTLNPDPESLLEAGVTSAQIDHAQGKSGEAAARIETLLSKVAADHWRRAELVQLRLALTKNEAGKRELIDKARAKFEANPQDENAAREVGELLQAADMQREALAAFLAASKKFPHSEPLERQVLDLFDRLGSTAEAEAFLKERIAANPLRSDLVLRLVRTLFAAGKSDEARDGLAKLLAVLPEDQRGDRLVEMARQLRRNALPAEAAGLLEQAVKAMPQRVDLRRELGETYLALGRRSAAGELFAKGIDPAAPVEYATDVVQFLVGQNFLAEARRMLEARAAVAPLAFELELIFTDIHGQLGNFPEGAERLSTIRPQADTEARYASWLQSALKFHEAFERQDEFLKEEMIRIKSAKKSGEAWTSLQFQQFILLCEAAGHQPQSKMMVESLSDILKDKTLPPQFADQVRGLLVNALSKDANASDEVQRLLVEIMSRDTAGTMIDLNRLRLAQIYDKAQRGDLAYQALQLARPEAIMQPGELAACWPLYLKYDLIDRAQAAVIRLTALEPSNLGHWEKRLSLQAKLGEEEGFRTTIQQILAGLKEVKLSDESLNHLRKHLEVSYWRGIVRRFQNEEAPEPDTLAKILDDLQAISRSRQLEPHEAAWVLWTRGWVLAKLNRNDERDRTIAELQDAAGKAEIKFKEEAAKKAGEEAKEKEEAREALAKLGGGAAAVAQSPSPVPGSQADDEEPPEEMEETLASPVIRFPDGLNLSLDSALSLLKEPALRQSAPVKGSEGPVGSLATAWSFQAPPERSITQIFPSAADKLAVVQDSYGDLAAVSLQTGKMLWQIPAPKDTAASAKTIAMAGSGRRGGRMYLRGGGGSFSFGYGTSYYQSQLQYMDPNGLAMQKLSPPMAVLERRLFTWENKAIICREISTGKTLWEAGFDTRSAGSASAPPMTAGDGRLYAAFLEEGHAVALELKSGKVVWQALLPGRKGNAPVYPLTKGIDYNNGLVLVYGLSPTLLEAATGRARWTLQEGTEPSFPVTLKSAESDESILNPDKEKSAKWTTTRANAMMNNGQNQQLYLAYTQLQSLPVVSFMQQGGKIVSLANRYFQAGQGPVSISATLTPDRLIIMDESSVGAFSLKLPMGGATYTPNGMFLGASQDKLAFLNNSSLTILATGTEKTTDIILKELGGQLPQLGAHQGCVSGSRVYVTGLKGVGVWHIHTGARIGFIPWPAEWEKEAAKIKPLPKTAGSANQPYYANYQGYQGNPGAVISRRGSMVNSSTTPQGGISGMTIAPRCWVAGDLLITALSPELIIALRTPPAAP